MAKRRTKTETLKAEDQALRLRATCFTGDGSIEDENLMSLDFAREKHLGAVDSMTYCYRASALVSSECAVLGVNQPAHQTDTERQRVVCGP